MKYIQSFYQYPVTFSSIGKTVPAKDADGELRNIAEFEDKEIEVLTNKEPLFRDLVNRKKYRVLDHLPNSYRAASTLVNEANERAAKAEAELAALKAQLGDRGPTEAGPAESTEAAEPAETGDVDLSKMDYKALQAYAKERGIENVSVKKSELIEAIKNLK